MDFLLSVFAIAVIVAACYGVYKLAEHFRGSGKTKATQTSETPKPFNFPNLKYNTIHGIGRSKYHFNNMLNVLGYLLKTTFNQNDMEQILKTYLLFEHNVALIEKNGEFFADESYNAIKYHNTNKFTSIIVDEERKHCDSSLKEEKTTMQIYESKLNLHNLEDNNGLYFGIECELRFSTPLLSVTDIEVTDDEMRMLSGTNSALMSFTTKILSEQVGALLFCFYLYGDHVNASVLDKNYAIKNYAHKVYEKDYALNFMSKTYDEIVNRLKKEERENIPGELILFEIERENIFIKVENIVHFGTNEFILTMQTK